MSKSFKSICPISQTIICNYKLSNLYDVFQEGPQRKKRKSEAGQVAEKADLLAMGTAAGTVLIYSTVKGALHCTLVSLEDMTCGGSSC